MLGRGVHKKSKPTELYRTDPTETIFKPPIRFDFGFKWLKTDLILGATIVDQTVTIRPAINYVPKVEERVIVIDEQVSSPQSYQPIESHGNRKVYVDKAHDVVTGIFQKGSALRQDALNKAKAFDEKHQLSASASARVISFDRRVGISEKFTLGISAVNEKVKSVDQKLHVSDKTMAVITVAEQKLTDTGAAVKTNRYVLAGTSWLNGAFGKVARVGHVAGSKTREKFQLAVSNLTAKDGESGWSSLHRALHFGHFSIASLLIQAGASLTAEDSKYRTPVDLLSGPVSQVIGNNLDSVATEVYSWGSGTNYQLGTGNAHIQKLPGKVDALNGAYIKIITASKFHSIAVGSSGELYTWGFGRGGRLGHPDFDVHRLLIFHEFHLIARRSPFPFLFSPRIGSRRVKAVAAAKHHTVIATETGEVFTWGSNREEGFAKNTHRKQEAAFLKLFSSARIEDLLLTFLAKQERVDLGCRGRRRNRHWFSAREGTNSGSNNPGYGRLRESAGAVRQAECGTILLGREKLRDFLKVRYLRWVWGWLECAVKERTGEGQLGYTSVDTQPTPKRVSCLRVRIVAVAAANKHTAAVTESGEVFTWGCNKEGQLGYGTSNSASNYAPRMVEYLKGKTFKGVSAAKYHTIVLSVDGEVFTWGHRLVNPRRVIVSRSLKKCGTALLKFHRMERLHVISVSAGMTHSCALTDDGALFYWASSDPDLRCEQVNSLSGKNFASISSGKYWTATVTTTGDVYMWDGKKYKHGTPVITRLPGIKHVTSACVGETHLLAVCALYHPPYIHASILNHQTSITKSSDDIDGSEEELLFADKEPDILEPVMQHKKEVYTRLPTLKSLCEKVAAEFIVEPRNAIQLLEIADSLEAENLRKHCEDLVIRNFDYIFTVSAPAIGSASLEILARLENLLDAKSSEPWCYRRLPTTTATFPVILYSEEEGECKIGNPLPRGSRKSITKGYRDLISENFLQKESEEIKAVSKQVRALRKKLQQIEMLESKQQHGHALDDQQIEKLQSRSAIESELAELGFPLEEVPKLSFSLLPEGKGNKKADTSKNQRRKSKQKLAQSEFLFVKDEIWEENILIKSFTNERSHISKAKENMAIELNSKGNTVADFSLKIPNVVIHDSSCNVPVQSTSSKRKSKKGGLSLFLSGALDDTPKDIPPPTPKYEGPAWGGAKSAKGPTSLRDIQNEQSKTKDVYMRPKEILDDSDEVLSFRQVRLGSFMTGSPSTPVAVKPTPPEPALEGEKSAPPWSSSGTSPIYPPSLRNIQMQQEKKHQSNSHSPKTTSGFTIAAHVTPSESGATVPSRWFKPEAEPPSSIRAIQIEEKAMKDLKRFYSSVSLVRIQPQPP
ncbi:Ultraviolet-B receptor UVR8 [Platanthera zijinensis]|uniref:Ultraviolet-B receptor UVR8 n=1 Tax=Platanthera zijinensis TaxID=2320716 RepID=A0AAP0C473_9ASPA